jgi:hypothetical protein
MKLLGLAVWWIAIPWFDFDCRHPAEPPLLRAYDVFSTSFEADADTAAWRGYGSYRFVSDAPPGGGGRSLEVAGGCIVPHAVHSLVVPQDGSMLTLIVWGRLVANGGGVSVRRADAQEELLQIAVTDSVWTRYEASASVRSRAGDTLRLELMSGGIVHGAMRVDLLEVLMTD